VEKEVTRKRQKKANEKAFGDRQILLAPEVGRQRTEKGGVVSNGGSQDRATKHGRKRWVDRAEKRKKCNDRLRAGDPCGTPAQERAKWADPS